MKGGGMISFALGVITTLAAVCATVIGWAWVTGNGLIYGNWRGREED